MYDSDCTAILGGTICASFAISGLGPFLLFVFVFVALVAAGVKIFSNNE